MAEERLHKVMAAAGFGSRRTCEQMIVDGLVQINGRTVSEVGVKVDPAHVEITVDGKPLRVPEKHIYIKMNKPRNVVSDIGGDTGGHKSVSDLLPTDMRRVFPVGRLDLNSEGLVLLTDDGELAHRLTHPSFEHPKTYYALVESVPPAQVLEQLRNGIDLPEGRTAPARVRVVEGLPADLQLNRGPSEGVWLEIILYEGKKRQIRHMLSAVEHPVRRLVRWAIGPLVLGQIRAGEWATMKLADVNALRRFVELPPLSASAVEEQQKAGATTRGRKGAAAGAAASRTRRSDGPRKSNSRTGNSERRCSGEGRPSRATGSRPYASRTRSDSTQSGGRRSTDGRSSEGRPASRRSEDSRGASGSTRSYSTRSYSGREETSSTRGGGQSGYGGRSRYSGAGRSESSGSGRTGASRPGVTRAGAERNSAGRSDTSRSGYSRSTAGESSNRTGSNRGSNQSSSYRGSSTRSSNSRNSDSRSSNSRSYGNRNSGNRSGGDQGGSSRSSGSQSNSGSSASRPARTSRPRRQSDDE